MWKLIYAYVFKYLPINILLSFYFHLIFVNNFFDIMNCGYLEFWKNDTLLSVDKLSFVLMIICKYIHVETKVY